LRAKARQQGFALRFLTARETHISSFGLSRRFELRSSRGSRLLSLIGISFHHVHRHRLHQPRPKPFVYLQRARLSLKEELNVDLGFGHRRCDVRVLLLDALLLEGHLPYHQSLLECYRDGRARSRKGSAAADAPSLHLNNFSPRRRLGRIVLVAHPTRRCLGLPKRILGRGINGGQPGNPAP
jgi:hypothetical protein